MLALAGVLLSGSAWMAAGPFAQDPAKTVQMTIHTPDAERVEIALDEIELQRVSQRAGPQAAAGTSHAVFQRETPGGSLFTLRGAATVDQLTAYARELEAQNPGARAYLVLYEAGRARNDATRQLLGRDVAVLIDAASTADVVLRPFSGYPTRAVESVSHAYVLEALDPLGALALADQLRATPGVKTAYPLLKRRQFLR